MDPSIITINRANVCINSWSTVNTVGILISLKWHPTKPCSYNDLFGFGRWFLHCQGCFMSLKHVSLLDQWGHHLFEVIVRSSPVWSCHCGVPRCPSCRGRQGWGRFSDQAVAPGSPPGTDQSEKGSDSLYSLLESQQRTKPWFYSAHTEEMRMFQHTVYTNSIR